MSVTAERGGWGGHNTSANPAYLRYPCLTAAHSVFSRQAAGHTFQAPGRDQSEEFAQFIGDNMRLSKVEYAPKVEASGIMNLCVGKNTPERKDYIMERLVVPVEE